MFNEITDFAQNAKFKTSGTGLFTYFNPDSKSQIRIQRNRKKGAGKMWYVTLHPISDDGITYETQTVQIPVKSMKEAREQAGKLYFEQIRKTN